MSGHYRKEKNCLNCGHHVDEYYCTHCGQPNLALKEPFWHFVGHSIGHYFHFDSKFFQTLVPLLTQPGQITLDYLAGKRARYIHPVSLYIFVSIIYFLIVPHALEENSTHEERKEKKEISQTDVKKRENAAKQIEAYKDQIDKIKPGLSEQIKNKINEENKDIISEPQFAKLDYKTQRVYLDSITKVNKTQKSSILTNQIAAYQQINAAKEDSSYSNYLQLQQTLPEEDQDHWFLQKLKRIDYVLKGRDKDQKIIEEEFKKYQPKQYFLLMPLLAFFIMINFRKNKIYYINHLVFTIHGMTAFFIVSIVTQPIKKYIFGLDSFVSNFTSVAVFFGIIWYLYRGLQLFYKRSRILTIRKTISLIVLYYIALVISAEIIKDFIAYFLT